MSIESEILALRDEEGFYKPQVIVDWAKSNPGSELHAHKAFLWNDDATAANEYRVGVARTLIRVHVKTDDGERNTFSLIQDRRNGNGYRELEPIFSNAELRKMALQQALRELRSWEKRYRHLKELAAIFDAAKLVEPPPPAAAA